MLEVKHNLAYFKKMEFFKIVNRRKSPFFNSLLRSGAAKKNSELEFDNRMSHHIILNNNIYAANKEFEKLKKRMRDMAKENKNFIKRYLRIVEKDCSDYFRIIKKLKKDCAKECGNKKLRQMFEIYLNATLKLASHLWPPVGLEDYIFKEIEKNLARKMNPESNFQEFNKALQVVLSPDSISFAQKRQQAILSLANKLKNKKIIEGSAEILKEYEKYYWLNDQGLEFKGELLRDFITEVKAVAYKNPGDQLKKIINERRGVKINKKRIIKKYGLEKEIICLFEQAARLPIVRSLRIEVIIQGAHELENTMFKKISERLEIKDVTDFYYWEISEGLKRGVLNKKDALKRKKDTILS